MAFVIRKFIGFFTIIALVHLNVQSAPTLEVQHAILHIPKHLQSLPLEENGVPRNPPNSPREGVPRAGVPRAGTTKTLERQRRFKMNPSWDVHQANQRGGKYCLGIVAISFKSCH